MSRLLNTHEAAERLGLAIATIAKLRVRGHGPQFVKLGAKVLYDESDLEAWQKSQARYVSTSDTRSQAPQTSHGRPADES